MNKIDIKNKKVTIVGGGLSGIAASILLNSKGAYVFLTEIGDTPEKQKELQKFEEENIPYELGKHTLERILDADMIIISPGISPEIPIIQEAVKKCIPIYSELEAASWFCPSPILAVTGTNGKSTTVTLLGELFTACGLKNVVAGNIGNPFSSIIQTLTGRETVILEISSFQLEKIKEFHPHISILLNVSFDHMDRYSGFDDYTKTKIRITENQTTDDYCIFNYDDNYIKKHNTSTEITQFPFSMFEEFETGAYVKNGKIIFSIQGTQEEVIHTGKLSLKGSHNLYNCLAAVSAAKLCSIPNETITSVLESFRGLEHRFELVDIIEGVTFINDSKATNTDSVLYALESLNKNVILMVGGKDKKGDLSVLNDLIKEKVKTLVVYGESSARMQKAWVNLLSSIETADTFEEAFDKAWKSSDNGDTILLSPACASFDMFKNFEERGIIFKQMVKRLKNSNA